MNEQQRILMIQQIFIAHQLAQETIRLQNLESVDKVPLGLKLDILDLQASLNHYGNPKQMIGVDMPSNKECIAGELSKAINAPTWSKNPKVEKRRKPKRFIGYLEHEQKTWKLFKCYW
jgi:hypothetical protein